MTNKNKQISSKVQFDHRKNCVVIASSLSLSLSLSHSSSRSPSLVASCLIIVVVREFVYDFYHSVLFFTFFGCISSLSRVFSLFYYQFTSICFRSFSVIYCEPFFIFHWATLLVSFVVVPSHSFPLSFILFFHS